MSDTKTFHLPDLGEGLPDGTIVEWFVKEGDVVRLTVRVRAPLGATVNFPTGLDSLSAVQALALPLVRDGTDSSVVDRVAVYRLSAWDVGR